jgi:hypothetical protein
MHEMDESREDLRDLVRDSSATNFDDLHRHMKAIQADMDCFDTCVICGEFGKCAPFICCKTPRHLKCEMEFSKANRLHWRLACATVKADGTKAFKKLRPPASETEYATQLMAAGPELYQLLRCSVCRKPLAAVRAAGDFAPIQWHQIKALREERQVRDDVSMRGSHPYLRAEGRCARFAALTGYENVKQFIRWQVPWVLGVAVLGAMIMFVLNVFAQDGESDVSNQLAVAIPVSFVIICMCWSCSHHGAASGTLQQVQEEQEEEEAVNRPTIAGTQRAISTSSAAPLMPSALASPPLGAATPASATVKSVASPLASLSALPPLHGAQSHTAATMPPGYGARLARSAAAAGSARESGMVMVSNPSSTDNLVALSSRTGALSPV